MRRLIFQERGRPASSVIIRILGEEQAPFDDTVSIPHPVLTTDIRAAFVDDAAHGVTVDGGTPAIGKAAHYRAAPSILDHEARRDVVFAGQQDFQPAAAGCAGGT